MIYFRRVEIILWKLGRVIFLIGNEIYSTCKFMGVGGKQGAERDYLLLWEQEERFILWEWRGFFLLGERFPMWKEIILGGLEVIF